LPPSCFIKKERRLFGTYPKGIYIQLFSGLSNGNLTGIENSNSADDAEVLKAPQPYQIESQVGDLLMIIL
jgi:hypothetical protein